MYRKDTIDRPLGLQYGLHGGEDVPVLRVAIPHGRLSSRQLRILARLVRVYGRGLGHFTADRHLQLHGIRLDETPEILAELAKAGLHPLQTSADPAANDGADPAARAEGHGRPDADAGYEFVRRQEPDFAAWADDRVSDLGVPGYATVALVPQAGAAGDATAGQMEAAADLAERFGFGELRLDPRQQLVLPEVKKRGLPALWRAAAAVAI
jgi:sulfite reductase (NADPH) hemoprotein beta-component